jgi:hypothetical protein
MKKYLLVAVYLLTLIAIYHHPISLPIEGNSPSGRTNENFVRPIESVNFALETV